MYYRLCSSSRFLLHLTRKSILSQLSDSILSLSRSHIYIIAINVAHILLRKLRHVCLLRDLHFTLLYVVVLQRTALLFDKLSKCI